MQTIGKFNLINQEEAKCDGKIARLIYKAAREASAKDGISIPGNMEHVRTYEKIFNIVLRGGTPQEVKAVYREKNPAGSLSKVGPIMPKDVMRTFRKEIESDVYVVKIEDKPARYMEKIEFMMANGMREPKNTTEEELVRPGGIWECMVCGKPHATPEPVLQPTCSECAMGKSKSSGSKKKSNVVAITNDIKRFANGYLTRKGTQTGDAILAKINELRSQIGLGEVDAERAKSASKVEDLM